MHIKDEGSHARTGLLKTPAFEAETPVFMPVGTQATVKGMTPVQLEAIGFSLILCNTYHLYLRPGVEVIQNVRGLHRFMGWKKGILTDSGGFQVYSLRDLRKVNDDGVSFRSHVDGSSHFFTPEWVVQFQEAFGSDIMMPLDECVPHDATWEYIKESLGRTHAWAVRSLNAKSTAQHLFGIVQGGMYPDLRRESVKALTDHDFSGFSIGGLSVGESKDMMYGILGETAPLLPEEKPRYLMGVGAPEDLVEGVERGIDMFDCIIPTRMGRTGTFLTWAGKLVIKNACHRHDPLPPDPSCQCYTCWNFSRAYLRHLFMADEMLGPVLASLHNLFFIHSLMEEIRKAVREGGFARFKKGFLERYLGSEAAQNT